MDHSWRDAAIATGLISSVPTLILPFIPQSATRPGSGLQRVMLCFAVGGMMGDVFLHLLPHLLTGGHHEHSSHNRTDEVMDQLKSHDHHDHHHKHHHHIQDDGLTKGIHAEHHNHHHDSHEESLAHGGEGHAQGHSHGMSDLLLPLLVLGGFMLFFISERVVRALLGGGGHSHGHHDSHSHDVARRKKDDDYDARGDDNDAASSTCEDVNSTGGGAGKAKLKIAGILNLAADALHNLSDGIAIGAAFASGSGLGFSTALATLLHELPHEIGDFAVLVQSGMGKWQAIGAQFATATAAFAGTAIGLLATQYAGLEQPLLATTAGGFVYVSCVAVMPDILNGSPTLMQGMAEIIAMCAGIALMAGVALLE